MPAVRSSNTDRGGATSNTKSSGPGGGSLNAPNRTAPSTSSAKGTDAKKGTKNAGASQQKPGAGANEGKVTSQNLSTAKKGLADSRKTALGKVAETAKKNANPSGTDTRYGGKTYSPGDMYKNAARSSSALNSVLNNTRLAGMNTRQTIDAVSRNMGIKNPVGRAGMIGTYDHESAGLNPDALGDKGTAYGLGQWRGPRRTALGNYAASFGQPINSPGLQTAFGITEMARSYPKTLAGLQNANSIRQAVAAMNDYERPRGWKPGGDAYKVAGWNDRVARSYNALDAFSAPAASASQVARTPAALQGRTWNTVLNSPYNTVFPERAPVTGTATSFPGRPRNEGARLHAGLDFAVAPGSVVTPTVPGKVVQVAYSPGAYGPTVQVMNTYGVLDRYALHQPQNIPVKVGQPVYAGTPLGVAGKLPGRASNFSHLHYERITPKDRAYNTVVRGMQDGSLAKARGAVAGSTSTPAALGRANIQSSTPQWAQAMGIDQNDSFRRGVGFQSPGAATPIGSQVASQTESAAAEAARLQRRGEALKTLQAPPTARPQPRPDNLITSGVDRNPYDTQRAYPSWQQSAYTGRQPTVPSWEQSTYTGRENVLPSNNQSLYTGRGPTVPSWQQSTYTGRPATVPSWQQSTYTGRQATVPSWEQGSYTGRAATVPSWQQSTYTGPAITPIGGTPPPKGTELAWGSPPMGGALPADKATALGVWSTNRTPPAAPHPGTPGSQTAEVMTDDGGSWGDWFKEKTGIDPVQVKQTVVDGQQQLKEAVDTYGEDAVLTYLQQQAGQVPRELQGYGNTQNDNASRYLQQAGMNMMMGGPASSGNSGSQFTASQLTELLAVMQAQGATPEEIAFVQAAIAAQTA